MMSIEREWIVLMLIEIWYNYSDCKPRKYTILRTLIYRIYYHPSRSPLHSAPEIHNHELLFLITLRLLRQPLVHTWQSYLALGGAETSPEDFLCIAILCTLERFVLLYTHDRLTLRFRHQT